MSTATGCHSLSTWMLVNCYLVGNYFNVYNVYNELRQNKKDVSLNINTLT